MNVYNQILVQSSSAVGMQKFMTKTYGWMTIGLLTTAVVAWMAINDGTVMYTILNNPLMFWGIMIGQIAAVMIISFLINRISAQTATALFIVYSALTGIFLSLILVRFASVTITSTLFITAGTFAATTLLGYTTKKDLSSVGGFLLMGLIGIIIATAVNIFLRNPTIYWAINYIGLAIFIGLTIYDTQKLKAMGEALEAENTAPEQMQKYAIFGALELYLDLINMFIFFLRIIGGRR